MSKPQKSGTVKSYLTDRLKHAGPGAADIVSSKVLYKHKGTGNHILFYDSHWKHGHGMKQVRNGAQLTFHGCHGTSLFYCRSARPKLFQKRSRRTGRSQCLRLPQHLSASTSLNSVAGYPRDVTVVSVVSVVSDIVENSCPASSSRQGMALLQQSSYCPLCTCRGCFQPKDPWTP